jgi:hypothetical protein
MHAAYADLQPQIMHNGYTSSSRQATMGILLVHMAAGLYWPLLASQRSINTNMIVVDCDGTGPSVQALCTFFAPPLKR